MNDFKQRTRTYTYTHPTERIESAIVMHYLTFLRGKAVKPSTVFDPSYEPPRLLTCSSLDFNRTNPNHLHEFIKRWKDPCGCEVHHRAPKGACRDPDSIVRVARVAMVQLSARQSFSKNHEHLARFAPKLPKHRAFDAAMKPPTRFSHLPSFSLTVDMCASPFFLAPTSTMKPYSGTCSGRGGDTGGEGNRRNPGVSKYQDYGSVNNVKGPIAANTSKRDQNAVNTDPFDGKTSLCGNKK